MLSGVSGAFIALALAIAPGAPLLVANATPRFDALVVAALPPPPENVTLQTRMFGTVDVPHKTHLDLRVSCKSCHGTGPVGKIDFTAKTAHDLCRGCHQTEQAGPTGCRDCHAVPNKPDAAAIAASQSPEAPVVEAPTANPKPAGATPPTSSEDPVTPSVAAPLLAGATDAPRSRGAGETPALAAAAPGVAPATEPQASPPFAVRRRVDDTPFTRSIEVGFITLSESGEDLVVGPALNVKAQEGRAVFVHSLASAGGSRRGHTLALLGGGLVTSVAEGWNVSAMGVGGLDAAYRTTQMFPALGLRVDVDWAARGARVFQAFSLSFLFVADLTRPRDEFGERVGGVLYGVTLTGAMRKAR
jgi:hypothetical protein